MTIVIIVQRVIYLFILLIIGIIKVYCCYHFQYLFVSYVFDVKNLLRKDTDSNTTKKSASK